MLASKKIKYYLLTTLILFLSCIILEEKMDIKKSPIENISLKSINKVMLLEGTLVKQRIHNNHSFMTFKENNSYIDIVMFSLNTTLKKGEYKIIGKIIPYQNKAQLLAYEIKLLHQ